jgi:4'-phosphopantetheinyl transferase
LAEHIGLDVNKIIIDIDSNKKPYLSSHPSVFFNVSHSGDYAVIAIAKCPVGVDVEYVNKDFEYEEILPTVFNQLEIDKIQNSINKHHTFYTYWTRKEAIVKAIGKGIDDDLIKLSVTEGLHSVPRALVGNFEKINVFSFNINQDYVGALAITEDIHDFEKIIFYPLPTSDKLKSLLLKR